MSVTVFTDGGARGNPGPAGAGVVIVHDGVLLAEVKKYLGEKRTNNWAEYEAVILALQKLRELGFEGETIEFKLDSLLVVEQINGKWKVKEPTLKPQVARVRELLKNFGSYSFTHIPREENAEADALVNEVLDENE